METCEQPKTFFIINNCDKLTTDSEQQAFLNFLRTKSATTQYTKELEGLAEGERKGAEQKALENAINFIKMNILTDEQIALGTGLPLKQIQQLKEEIYSTAK